MADLNQTLQRLEAALARVERAAAGGGGGGGGTVDVVALNKRISALESDRQRLSDELAALKTENERLRLTLDEAAIGEARLKEVTSRISTRLDGAIDQLRSVLAN